MNNATRILLIAAAAVLLVGAVLFCGAMAATNWNLQELSTKKLVTNEYVITEEYQSISIVTDTGDVVFTPSDSNASSVICSELSTMKHAVSVEGNTLLIEITDERKWYDYIGIHFGTPKITLSLPQGQYDSVTVLSATGDVKIPADFSFEQMQIVGSTGDVTSRASSKSMEITTSTGDICIESLSADSINLITSTGDTELEAVQCRCVSTTGSTGALSMENVIVAETLSIERTTGDVEFERCDAADIYIKTDTGEVEGSLLSEKVFLVSSDTGHIKVPKTQSGGKCEITTDTGDIKITIG